MQPPTLLDCLDQGRLWPADQARPAFTTMADAYRAAISVREMRQGRGEQPCGFKIGFTNRTIWPRYGVFAPIWGTVWNTTVRDVDSGTAMGELDLTGACQPRIEPEAVFGLRAAPAPAAGLDALFGAIDWIAPGFEVVQSHCPDWKFNAAESAADGGLHGRLLIGPRTPIGQAARSAEDLHRRLAEATVTLEQDGVVVESGRGAHVLDSPLQALRHFVDELARTPGAPALRAGDVVTTGTWTDAWPVRSGERWQARFSAPLPSLTVSFR